MNNENQITNPLDDFLEDTSSGNPFDSTNQSAPFADMGQELVQPPAEPKTNVVNNDNGVQEIPSSLQQTNLSVVGNSEEIEQSASPVQRTEQQSLLGADMFEAALQKAQAKGNQIIADDFAEIPPKFSYGKVKEDISDGNQTFDDVRQHYENDFPELSEKKRVAWTVSYGKVSRTILKPETDTISEIKADIEKSKPFLDSIKKAKTDAERKPECLVTPKVTGESKGDMASYKGIYPTYEEAMKENKAIMFVPSRDGKVYEIRNNDIGTFITPADCPPELSPISPGLTFSLPKIPYNILSFIVSFFRKLSNESQLEALANIYYKKEYEEYIIHIPEQRLSKASVDTENTCSEDVEGLLHVMDIHSHNTMPANFSQTDNDDEKATRVYAVIGRLDKFFPDITVRISNGGKFFEIPPEQVFELYEHAYPYPYEWEEKIINIKDRKTIGDKNEIL